MKALRWPALVLIAALLIVATLVSDRRAGSIDAADDVPVLAATMAKPDAYSGLWFCAGGTGVASGAADHRVLLINTTDTAHTASITAYGSRPSNGSRPQPVSTTLALAAYGRAQVRLGDLVNAPYVSATVEIDGGGVLVEHSVNGALGSDRGPCTANASEHWTVPLGTTATAAETPPAREVLVFFNPFPGDAVLDAEFSTENGLRGTPEQFKGLVVPGRSVVAVDLATAGVTVADSVAANITLKSGRIVVDRIQTYDQLPARRGLVLSSGVPAPARTWIFAGGSIASGRSERLVVHNPNDAAAQVDVVVEPDDPSYGAEPFELTVRPHQHVTLNLAAENRLSDFVSKGVPYTLVVQTADGKLVSAERLVVVTPGTKGAGVASSTGVAAGATRLVADFAEGSAPESSLALMNPSGATIAKVKLSVIANGAKTTPAGFDAVEIAPGGRRAIPLSQLGSGPLTMMVESSAPIVGERDLIRADDRAVAVAVPVASTVAPITGDFTTVGA